MSDVPAPEIPETEEDLLRETGDRLGSPYDDVFLPDGTLLEPMSVLDDFD
jgi:hypothetical protein